MGFQFDCVVYDSCEPNAFAAYRGMRIDVIVTSGFTRSRTPADCRVRHHERSI
jgi:hypothetical protein